MLEILVIKVSGKKYYIFQLHSSNNFLTTFPLQCLHQHVLFEARETKKRMTDMLQKTYTKLERQMPLNRLQNSWILFRFCFYFFLHQASI